MGHRNADILRFWAVFWLDGSSAQILEQGYEKIGRVCGINEDAKSIAQWLANRDDPWLLIIDNADDPKVDLFQYFPAGNRGTVLMTTRNPECEIHATVGSAKFGGMRLEEAVLLLLKIDAVEDASEDCQRLASSIVETLGRLALAIVQAGAYIRQKLCTMEEYCAIYSRQRQRLLAYRPAQADAGYKLTVYTTWEISIDKIVGLHEQAAQDAIELLHIFAFWHFAGISEEMFKQAWVFRQTWVNKEGWGVPEDMPQSRVLLNNDNTAWDPQVFREATSILLSFSLISIDGTDRLISMHPLVHTWARDRLDEMEHLRFWKLAASTIGGSVPWGKNLSDYKSRRLCLLHIHSCLENGQVETTFTGDEAHHIVHIQHAARFSVVYHESGHYEKALILSKQVVEATRRVLGAEHPDTLLAMVYLVGMYLEFSDFQLEALSLAEKVLEVRRRELGDEHSDTLLSKSILARTYCGIDRSQEAMELYEQVLKAGKRTLGNEHRNTLNSMANLAYTYSNLDRHHDALILEEQALCIQKETLGGEHPHTLRTMNNLANTYHVLGRKQEAVTLGTQLVATSKRTLGDEHPRTLIYSGNLAIYLSAGPSDSVELVGKDENAEGNGNKTITLRSEEKAEQTKSGVRKLSFRRMFKWSRRASRYSSS